MTEQQKDTLIAKMLDTPATLSPVEIEAILADEELRDIYQISVEVADACSPDVEVDVEKEWTQFSQQLHHKPSRRTWLPRVAAIFLGVLALSGIAKVIIDNIFTAEPAMTLAKVQDIAPDPILPILDIIDTKSQPADAEPAVTYPKRTSPRPTARQKEEEIDAEEYLRIDQARIDNELALLAAYDIEADYQCIIEHLADEGQPLPEDWQDLIVTITMQ